MHGHLNQSIPKLVRPGTVHIIIVTAAQGNNWTTAVLSASRAASTGFEDRPSQCQTVRSSALAEPVRRNTALSPCMHCLDRCEPGPTRQCRMLQQHHTSSMAATFSHFQCSGQCWCAASRLLSFIGIIQRRHKTHTTNVQQAHHRSWRQILEADLPLLRGAGPMALMLWLNG
jgi:hypothetical protein